MKKIVLLLIAISAALLALPLLSGNVQSVSVFLSFYLEPQSGLFAQSGLLFAMFWLLISGLALLAIKSRLALSMVAVLLVLMALLPLGSLLGSKHYIADLGGFPILGSGQGVIKYFAILVLAVSLVRLHSASRAELFWLNFSPVALVLLWIGSMKFFSFEAQGIVDLVSSSPLLSWLYLVADPQTASNLIGIYDISATLLLAAGYFVPRLFLLGFGMALAVFATTQSFLLSFAGAWQQMGILTNSGIFIIKDLWFIANLALVWHAFHRMEPQKVT